MKMITIMLENRGDWVMMGESRSVGCIKSDVRNFIVGTLADVDKGDRRSSQKADRHPSFFRQAYNTYSVHASSIAPKENERLKADRANTSSTTILGHIGPQSHI